MVDFLAEVLGFLLIVRLTLIFLVVVVLLAKHMVEFLLNSRVTTDLFAALSSALECDKTGLKNVRKVSQKVDETTDLRLSLDDSRVAHGKTFGFFTNNSQHWDI